MVGSQVLTTLVTTLPVQFIHIHKRYNDKIHHTNRPADKSGHLKIKFVISQQIVVCTHKNSYLEACVYYKSPSRVLIWFLSVTSHTNCIAARCLIDVIYLTACCLYQVMMTLHFLNDVANDAESTQKSKNTS